MDKLYRSDFASSVLVGPIYLILRNKQLSYVSNIEKNGKGACLVHLRKSHFLFHSKQNMAMF